MLKRTNCLRLIKSAVSSTPNLATSFIKLLIITMQEELNQDATSALEQLNQLLFEEKASQYLSSSIAQEYIAKLGQCSVDALNAEPQKLQEEKQNILERTQELAVSHYQTFIQAAECSRQSFDQFNEIQAKLDSLLECIPIFEQKCLEFVASSEDINKHRKLNTITLTKNGQLLEVLELPQLMDNFIKENLFEEALELAAYVYRLQQKQPEIPIIKNIVGEVDKLWLLLQRKLIAQLSTEIQLPKCLQVVGHLRQMVVFSETELRLKFLQARNCWLEKTLSVIPRTDINQYLRKTIEVTRVNLFSIITQYRAIFNDDEHSPLSMRNQLVNQNCIFFCWLREKISEFLRTLDVSLQDEGVDSLDTILGQCMYFGLSFSKVGCDFRPLVAPIFLKAIERSFQKALNDATRAFDVNIEKFTLINKNHPKLPTTWKNKACDPLQPPENLMEFYPLADYINKLLAAFNTLRLTPAISNLDNITMMIERSLVSVAGGIFALYAQEHQAFTPNAKDSFTRLCMCFADDLVPYVQKTLHVIYPPNNVAQFLGSSVLQLQNCGISYLHRDLIVAKISNLLPGKVISVQSANHTQECEENTNIAVVDDIK